MELKDYWNTVRRRWRAIVACVVLALAAASVLTWSATPQYSSTTRLFVSTSPSDTADALAGNTFATQRVASYAENVKSLQLADQVSEALGAEYNAGDLSNKISATVVPETVILELVATDPDPTTARDIAQAYAESLSKMVAELETPNSNKRALVTASVVDDARINDTPISPNVARNLGLATVLGLLIGLGVAVAREMLDTTIKSADDVETATSAPVIGHIYQDVQAAQKSAALVLDAATPWAESFRVLRTNMQYVQVDSPTKVFVVSSSLPGEGKSTNAINLAVTLAMANEKVALVECDLRRPLIADRLGLVGAVGTTSVLVGKISLDEALQPYGSTGLQVLASGPIPPNPSEILQSQAMHKLLADLRERFDVVIIDAPPLLPVTDAALLTTQADGALVVVRYGKTTRDQLTHAVERIDAADGKVLGVVVNLAPSKKRGSTYGYGYGYGYAPDPEKVASEAAAAHTDGGPLIDDAAVAEHSNAGKRRGERSTKS